MTDEVERVALRECPFCGGEARLVDNTGQRCSADHAWVWCAACRFDGHERNTVAEAIAAWNKRSAPPSDALREECERLTLEHGPIVIDKYGEALAWRPLDYGTWTEFAHLSGNRRIIQGHLI